MLGVAAPCAAAAAASPAVRPAGPALVGPIQLEAAPPDPRATVAQFLGLLRSGDVRTAAGLVTGLPGAPAPAPDVAASLARESAWMRAGGFRPRAVRALIDGDVAAVLVLRGHADESLATTIAGPRPDLTPVPLLRGDDGLWRLVDVRRPDAVARTGDPDDADDPASDLRERIAAVLAAAGDLREETRRELWRAARPATAAVVRSLTPTADEIRRLLGDGWTVIARSVVGDLQDGADPGAAALPAMVRSTLADDAVGGFAEAVYARGDDRIAVSVRWHATPDDAERSLGAERYRRLAELETLGWEIRGRAFDRLSSPDERHVVARPGRWVVEVRREAGSFTTETDEATWALMMALLDELTQDPDAPDAVVDREARPGAASELESESESEARRAPDGDDQDDRDIVLAGGLASLLPTAAEAGAATGVRWTRRFRLLVADDGRLLPRELDSVPAAARRLLEPSGAERVLHVEYVDRDRPDHRIAVVIVGFDTLAHAGDAYGPAFAADPTRALVSPEVPHDADQGRLYAVYGRFTIDSRRLGDGRGPELGAVHELVLRRAMALERLGRP
jgi:hypothetical protein